MLNWKEIAEAKVSLSLSNLGFQDRIQLESAVSFLYFEFNNQHMYNQKSNSSWKNRH